MVMFSAARVEETVVGDGYEIERVKEEPCEEPWCSDTGCEGPGHYEQDETGLVPDHGQSTVDKVKVEEEEVKDESVCKEEPPGSDTGPCSPGPYSAQAELAPELYIETQHRVANQTGFTKNPLQKCEVQHMSISDQHRLPESQAQNAADQRMAVAGTPQDIDQVFECETCGKTFNQIFYFTSHMQLHEYNLKIVETKTKTYSCNSCGKQFETNKLLGEHELTHVTRDYR
ncbi:fez family zinc finger protein 1-like [Cydia fagiglandana]|uniref:fez family zinc finger protein 1-like n=1 Tax=Cydia fagiglandana TaxID=1458189 RepID=UPI002FEE4360